jgi:hypothetical protein
MKRFWIEYRPTRTHSPMTYWVHREADGKLWYESQVHDPPLEPAVSGKGFPLFFVEYREFTFMFASLAELRVAIKTLGRKLLPTTIRLPEERGGGVGRIGPNQHWLSRLPGAVTSWRYREPAVEYLRVALGEFEKELGRLEA